MEDEREGPLPCFFLEDCGDVVVGLAGVDDERQAGLARGRDVAAEAGRLRRVVAGVVVVEPGLADGDAARMLGEPHEIGGRDLGLLMRVVRMRADAAPDFGVLLGDGA